MLMTRALSTSYLPLSSHSVILTSTLCSLQPFAVYNIDVSIAENNDH